MAKSRTDRIQRMLISRLEKQIDELKRRNEELIGKLRKINTESAAKIYVLEEERDSAQRYIRKLEQDLEHERSKMRRALQAPRSERKER